MFTAYIIVILLVVAANSYMATLDVMRAETVVGNATRVDVPLSWLLPLGALKAAGALGVLAGIGVPVIGIAAAVGLIVFFLGAIAAHLRVGSYSTMPFPVAFLLLAVGALVLRLATS